MLLLHLILLLSRKAVCAVPWITGVGSPYGLTAAAIPFTDRHLERVTGIGVIHRSPLQTSLTYHLLLLGINRQQPSRVGTCTRTRHAAVVRVLHHIVQWVLVDGIIGGRRTQPPRQWRVSSAELPLFLVLVQTLR